MLPRPGARPGKGLVREGGAKAGQDVLLAPGERLHLPGHGDELIGCPLIALLPRVLGGGYPRQRVVEAAKPLIEPVDAHPELVSLRPCQAEPAPELVADAEHLAGEVAAELGDLPCPGAERDREVRHATRDGEQDQQQCDRHEHLPASRSR